MSTERQRDVDLTHAEKGAGVDLGRTGCGDPDCDHCGRVVLIVRGADGDAKAYLDMAPEEADRLSERLALTAANARRASGVKQRTC